QGGLPLLRFVALCSARIAASDHCVHYRFDSYSPPGPAVLTAFFDILLGGVFHAAVLFLVAAGLQLVFGVQKIVNLACGSFYALGAYFGVSAVGWAVAAGAPAYLFLPVLLLAGVVLGAIGPPIEALLRTIYRRDEAFQLLLTFALVLMFQ